jgi:hypothetical protein
MEEIKLRLDVMGTLVKPEAASLIPPWARGEFCYLQLRVVCELIALAALIAHGDIEATRTNKLQALYQADKIVKALSEIHSDFYPQPRGRYSIRRAIPYRPNQ